MTDWKTRIGKLMLRCMFPFGMVRTEDEDPHANNDDTLDVELTPSGTPTEDKTMMKTLDIEDMDDDEEVKLILPDENIHVSAKQLHAIMTSKRTRKVFLDDGDIISEEDMSVLSISDKKTAEHQMLYEVAVGDQMHLQDIEPDTSLIIKAKKVAKLILHNSSDSTCIYRIYEEDDEFNTDFISSMDKATDLQVVNRGDEVVLVLVDGPTPLEKLRIDCRGRVR